MITERINIDVRPGGVPVVIHVTQYEAGLREFVFTPYASDGELTVVAGSATLEGTKPDGYAFQQACEMIDGVITYTLQEQLCAVEGRVWSRLVIRDDDGGMIGYTAIVWVVGCAGVKDDAVMSDSDISALRQFLDEFGEIDAYRGALEQALADVEEASDRITAETSAREAADDLLTARMDSFARLPDGSLSTAADAELADIRVEANGTTAATAGDAVRAQYTDLKNALIQSEIITLRCESGNYNNSGKKITAVNRIRSISLVSADLLYSITIPEGYEMLPYRYDAGQNFISYNLPYKTGTVLASSIKTAGTRFFGFAFRKIGATSEDISADVATVEAGVSLVFTSDEQINNTMHCRTEITTDTDLDTVEENGFYLLYSGHTYTNAPSFYTSGAAWLFVYAYPNHHVQFFIHANTMRTARRRYYTSGDVGHWQPWVVDDDNAYTVLKGKKISILGDSISTFNGYIVPGYSYYYPHDDVDAVEKTWWMQVINRGGLSLVADAAWSGSWVCYDSSVTESTIAKVGYKNERVAGLASGSTTPDIIVVLMGTNDFSVGKALGTLDENTELPDVAGDITQFRPAYAAMINNVRTTYPHAHVYCCTLIQRYKNTDTAYPIKNGNGDALALYNKTIVDVAAWMGCEIIRLDTVISLGEVAELTVDGFLHPNAAGMKRIADKVLQVLAQCEKNYV